MAADKPLRIGFSRDLAIGIPFWTIVEHGARVRAREFDMTLLVHHSVTAHDQAEDIAQLTEQHVDVIIFAAFEPNDPDFIAALQAASAAGIPLIALDIAVPHPVTSLIRSDDFRGAASGAAYLAGQLGGQGKVVHFQGKMQNPVAQLRSDGVRQALRDFPAIEIMHETDAGQWDRGAARAIMREVLAAHPDVRGVIAANDPMALGAIDAIAEVGRTGQVIVVGIDGDPDALLAVEAGIMAATVRRAPYDMGCVAVETAHALIQDTSVPREILLDDMTLVTRETCTRAAMESLQIMPGVINDLMENSAAMASERTMLRTIIDSLPHLIYVKDRDGRFVVANTALAQLSGASDPGMLVGKTDQDIFPQQLAQQYHADEQAILQSGVPLLDKEEPLWDADGTQRWLVTTKIPIRDHRDQIQWIVGSGRDITERKQADEERQRLQNELIAAQALALEELSTPLIPISDNVLVMPLIGRVDARRASQILETLLTGIYEQQADLAIVDITGVNVVDTQVAYALIQTAQAVKLLGAQVVLTGIRPEVAQTLVSLGINLNDIVTLRSLQQGIAYALQKR